MTKKCPECGKGDFSHNEPAGYGIRKKYSCGHGEVAQINNEVIQFSEKIFVERFFHFKLSDKLFLGGKIVDSSDIKFEFDSNDKNFLIGFTIKGKFDDANESREFAVHQGTKLTNLLSTITCQFIYHNRPDVTIIENEKMTRTKSFTADAILVKLVDLNLTDTKVGSLLEEDSKLNKQLDHFANGLKAFEDNQYDEAVRRFCLIFEGAFPINLGNYKYLRNALSHSEIDDKTIEGLRIHFKIECAMDTKTGKKSLDTTSPTIRQELKKHAEILKRETMTLLQSKISL